MDDQQILQRIHDIVTRQHELRAEQQAGELSTADEQAQVRGLQEALDQCWDLLRQRRAAREFDRDPDTASERPVPEVEGYQQ
ncbi:DUF2630 family protein [Angustibacter aerolatus]